MNKATKKDGFMPSAFGIDEKYRLAKVNKNGSKTKLFELGLL